MFPDSIRYVVLSSKLGSIKTIFSESQISSL